MQLPQQPAAVSHPSAAGAGWFDWLYSFGTQPGVVEVLLAMLLFAVLLLVWWRLARLVQGARRRSALADYLLGVEQALQGDLGGARKRLEAVVAQDPENLLARLLLGKVLTGLGEAAQANKHHVYLKTAFGIDSAENDLLLAQSLLAAGQIAEAGDVAEAALAAVPARADAWEFVWRTRLRNSDFPAAARAGRRLLTLRGGPGAQPWLAREVARAAAEAGLRSLAAGDAQGARQLLQMARASDRHGDGVALLAARIDAAEHGVDAVAAKWLDTGALLPANPGRAEVALPATRSARAPSRVGGPAATDQGLAPAAAAAGPEQRGAATRPGPRAPWSCARCAAPLEFADADCAVCGAAGAPVPREPLLLAELASASQCMDAIEQNDAYVRRLAQQALDGSDTTAASSAREALVVLRERAVPEVLARAWHGDDRRRELAVEVLRRMGPSIAPALFAASDALEQERLLPLGSRSPAALVGRVVQGFDREALPHVAALFASARPEHRKILIDYFLGLADVGEFQLVLERFPPVEILHRLNRCDATVLRRFLEAVPAGHFLAEVLLLEPTFHREEEVLLAIPGSRQPAVLEAVLVRRGTSRSLARILIARLLDPALRTTAARILRGHGDAGLDHLLAAYTDPEAAIELRAALGDLLAQGGEAAARRLCDTFGPEPTGLDEQVCDVLRRIGDAAVPALAKAYGEVGWLERLAGSLVNRHTNRRAQIVRALGAIGSAAAAAALDSLRADERDMNLRLRLEQTLHGLRQPPKSPEVRGG